MPEYNIPLRNGYADLDIQRIATENATANAVIVYDAEAQPIALLVSNNFLKKFRAEDKVSILGEKLSILWGTNQYRLTVLYGKLRLTTKGSQNTLQGFRYIQMTTKELEKTVLEIKEAIESLSNRKIVKVEIF